MTPTPERSKEDEAARDRLLRALARLLLEEEREAARRDAQRRGHR